MDKGIKMKLGAGIAALALVVAGGGYYHFHVSSDTPEFAIKTIHKSIEKHDTKTFYRFVNVDSVIDSGYDGFIEGLTSSASLSTPDAKETVKDFMQMFREPLVLSLKAAIDSYVAASDLKVDENIGVAELLERTGLNDASVRDVKNIQINDANRDEAFADLMIFHPELEKEFPLQIVLTRGADKQWQVRYLTKAGEINSRHEATVREAEQKYGMILAAGNLARKNTRDELKDLINDVFQKDWEERKQELFSLKVPKDAEPLQNLYMRICDLSIAASKDYAKWMDDNNPTTIKAAEDKIHQVQTLITEAASLAKRMTS